MKSLIPDSMSIFFYDLETCCPKNIDLLKQRKLYFKHARIIQIAICNRDRSASFSCYIDPKCKIDIESNKIHGINDQDIINSSALPFKDTLPLIEDWLESQRDPNKPEIILIAHNGSRFDKPIIEAEYLRSKRQIPGNYLFSDSVPFIKKAYPLLSKDINGKYIKGSLKLNNLYQNLFKKPFLNGHDALVDTYALCDIFNYLTTKKMDQKIATIFHKSLTPASEYENLKDMSLDSIAGIGSYTAEKMKRKKIAPEDLMSYYLLNGRKKTKQYLENELGVKYIENQNRIVDDLKEKKGMFEHNYNTRFRKNE